MERGRYFVNAEVTETSHFQRQAVEISSINTLVQPRKTFDGEICYLADNIAARGLISPIIIARFDKKGITRHLEAVNKLWGTEYQPKDLLHIEEEGALFYYVLIAGERRYRAAEKLLTEGCTLCQANYGRGSCYERHFGNQKIEASVCTNIHSDEFFYLQTSENTHQRIPPEEEAIFYVNFYRVLKENDPNFSLARFAREVGRNPATIREALRYYNLPSIIQDLVEKRALPYGVATQIARLQEIKDINVDELTRWAIRAIVEQMTVKEIKDKITRYIEERNSNQAILPLFSAEEIAQQQRQYRNRVVEKKTVLGLWSFKRYLVTVDRLHREGMLGKEDSPFSKRSPIRVFLAFIQTQRMLLEGGLLPQNKRKEAESVIEEIEKRLIQIEAETVESTASSDVVVFQP